MKRGVDLFRQGSRWVIGRDSNLNFWHDNWTHKGPIRQLIQCPLPMGVSDWKVKDIASIGGWNWELIPFDVPQELKLEIQAIPYALAARSMDRIAWKDSLRGGFNMKSAYQLAAGLDQSPDNSGNWIWKLQSLPKIQFFLWKCAHNSVGVNECLATRGVTTDPTCSLCRKKPESILHALQDCDLARAVWIELGALGVDRDFFSANLGDWMVTNGKLDISLNQFSPPWKIIFSFAVWNLWKNRNQVMFKRQPPSPKLAKDILDYAVEFFYCAVSKNYIQPRVTIQVSWGKPEQGWMKINTDGCLLGIQDWRVEVVLFGIGQVSGFLGSLEKLA